jgi:hypothetical protein
MSSKSHWVIDYETILNCTVLVAEHYKTDERKIFVIHRFRNDIEELIGFLETCKLERSFHITFNGLSFDGQITEYILKHAEVLVNGDPQYIANEIYNYAQTIIDKQTDNEFPDYSEKDLSIAQIDVFKLNHWDNAAKRSSLKWIQYTMDWKNMQEMPIHHGQYIDTQEQIDMIISYCCNDVSSTKNILVLCKDQVKLRKELSKEYDLPLMSASEPKIAKSIFLYFLSKKTGISKYDLNQLRTRRTRIELNDIILPYIQFKDPLVDSVLHHFRRTVIENADTTIEMLILKGKGKYSINHKGMKIDCGLGGIHGAAKVGVWESVDNTIIMSSDVQSYYPNLAIKNRWAPAHMDIEAFCEQYEWFFTERLKIPKTDIRNYVYKIILNCVYGLSNEYNSFLYDPELTLKITINGQLSLLMLYDILMAAIPGAEPIMLNTDGLEMRIPINYKETYLQICSDWEMITKLTLEHDTYKKIILRDVNNYIAINTADKIKSKGAFEYRALPLHKNKSMLIIPMALHEYFVNGISPEQTVMSNQNIFDYCAGVKAKGTWVLEDESYSKGNITRTPLSKVVRYYITNKGNKIIKRNVADGREIRVEAGNCETNVFNQYEELPWHKHDVNTGYYLNMIYKEINKIEMNTNQLTLF